jgi:uncharacterized protein (DUF1684 family)
MVDEPNFDGTGAFMKVVVMLALSILFSTAAMADEQFVKDANDWRKESEDTLRSKDGYLALVGLSWLKEGQNTIGSNQKASIVLPKSAPSELGRITLQNGRAILRLKTTEGVEIDGTPAKQLKDYNLKTDADDKKTVVKFKTVTFFLIKRANGIGVRIKDSNSEARKSFSGKKWYPLSEKYVITAKWIAFKDPKALKVPDVMGNTNEEENPGYATFELDGQTVNLYPIKEGDYLFFIFRDKTSGRTSYGGARFLFTEPPVNGKLVLDFNRAENPPCAFTPFATCPLPPKENYLNVAIPAGEEKPTGH